MQERNRRGDSVTQAEVFSVTKYAGFVPSLDYFDRQVFSRDTSNYKLVQRGDLAYATIHLDEGSLGILRDASNGLISPMYTVFEADRRQVEPEFLYAIMKLPQMVARYRRIGEGSVHRRKSIVFDRLARLTIAIPPLPEQRAIANILDSIDQAIEAADALVSTTEQLRDSLLHNLLTRGLPGRHTEWKEVPGLGTIPTDWETSCLGDILESTTYGTNVSLGENGGVPVLRMKNLQNGKIDLSDTRRANLADKELLSLDLVRGDILFNRTNSLDLVGKVGVVQSLPKLTSFASYLVRLRAKKELADPFWLAALMASDSCQSRIRRFATPGVSQANINPTALKTLIVPLPPLPEQQAIAAILESVDESIGKRKGTGEGLRKLKESASDALLTGRVRVPAKGN